MELGELGGDMQRVEDQQQHHPLHAAAPVLVTRSQHRDQQHGTEMTELRDTSSTGSLARTKAARVVGRQRAHHRGR
jgi:hypothetical protein